MTVLSVDFKNLLFFVRIDFGSLFSAGVLDPEAGDFGNFKFNFKDFSAKDFGVDVFGVDDFEVAFEADGFGIGVFAAGTFGL